MQVFVQLNLNLSAVIAYANVFITAEINGCFRCYLICCTAFSRKLPAFIGICSCFFQLAYVYSVGIFNTCFNIDNLTFSTFTAYRYRITSVSNAAKAQSNSAFTSNLGIMTKSSTVINRCLGYFISRAENNVILTAYLVIITDNLVAVCDNFIFAADYGNVRCVGNSIFITIYKVILGSLFCGTGYFILYACKLGVCSVVSLVAAADCHYGAACIFAGLHSFNSLLLCFRNRNIIPIGVNTDLFNRVGNLVAGTPD